MAAREQPLFIDGTHLAGADLSALQFQLVLLNSSGLIVQNTTAGGDIYGVLMNKPKSGQSAQIGQLGKYMVKAGAAVTLGAKVMSDNQGRVVAATATNKGIGYAEDAAAAAGEIITVTLTNLGTQ